MRPIVLIAVVIFTDTTLACATCSGPTNDPQSIGMSAAILALLGVFCAVFFTAATFIGVLAWRIRHVESEIRDQPPEGRMTLTSTDRQ